jgi:hypothetical protein
VLYAVLLVNATLRLLYPGERPGAYFIGRLFRPQNRSVRVRKHFFPPGFESRTVRPVTSRYTDLAILTLIGLVNVRALEDIFTEDER